MSGVCGVCICCFYLLLEEEDEEGEEEGEERRRGEEEKSNNPNLKGREQMFPPKESRSFCIQPMLFHPKTMVFCFNR